MDGDGLDQITAGTAGDEPKGNLGSEGTILPHEAVHHLIEGAITSDAYDRLGAPANGFTGKPGGISRACRKKDVKRSEPISSQGLDPRPRLTGRACRCMGIDDKGDLC
jgi:hypothetical protein